MNTEKKSFKDFLQRSILTCTLINDHDNIYFAYRYFDCSLTFTHMFIFSFIHNDILRNTVCRATQKQKKK